MGLLPTRRRSTSGSPSRTVVFIDSYDLVHLSYGLAEPIAIGPDGYLEVPVQPGLGIDLDWELLRSNVIAELA